MKGDGLASVEVSVRGAGIFGLSIAWMCTKAGATVEVVDPGGVGAGASGGIVGALAPHVPENWNPKKQFQLESLLMAEDFWAEIADAGGGAPGYARSGRVQPIADEHGVSVAKGRAEGAKVLWRGEAEWQIVEDAKGWGVESPCGQYVFDTLSAHLHPRQACAALALALRARGVEVLAEPEAEAKVTIWANGVAGLDAISKQVGREAGRGIKGQAVLLQADKRGLPQLFADALHIIPHLDGTVAIGSTTERDFDHPTTTDEQIENLLQRAYGVVPDLRNAPILERWAGLRPRARSRAPMLGAWPGRPGHFIANGGFKIGFGMAPKVAACMSQLVLEGVDAIPEGFDVAASL